MQVKQVRTIWCVAPKSDQGWALMSERIDVKTIGMIEEAESTSPLCSFSVNVFMNASTLCCSSNVSS